MLQANVETTWEKFTCHSGPFPRARTD